MLTRCKNDEPNKVLDMAHGHSQSLVQLTAVTEVDVIVS